MKPDTDWSQPANTVRTMKPDPDLSQPANTVRTMKPDPGWRQPANTVRIMKPDPDWSQPANAVRTMLMYLSAAYLSANFFMSHSDAKHLVISGLWHVWYNGMTGYRTWLKSLLGRDSNQFSLNSALTEKAVYWCRTESRPRYPTGQACSGWLMCIGACWVIPIPQCPTGGQISWDSRYIGLCTNKACKKTKIYNYFSYITYHSTTIHHGILWYRDISQPSGALLPPVVHWRKMLDRVLGASTAFVFAQDEVIRASWPCFRYRPELAWIGSASHRREVTAQQGVRLCIFMLSNYRRFLRGRRNITFRKEEFFFPRLELSDPYIGSLNCLT